MNRRILFEDRLLHGDVDEAQLDALKVVLDMQLYFFGKHFRAPDEINFPTPRLGKELGLFSLRSLMAMCRSGRPQTKQREPSGRGGGRRILSNAYFSANEELEKLGFELRRPPWDVCDDAKLFITLFQCKLALRTWPYLQLASKKFQPLFRRLWGHLSEYFRKTGVQAVIFPNDQGFFENVAMRVIRELGRPNFVFLHGLPGYYDHLEPRIVDYLVVWGDRIRDHYVASGIPRERIIVSGHPWYKSLSGALGSRFDFTDVLVLGKATNGVPFRKTVFHQDRGNSLLFVEMVRRTLQRLGIKNIRLRLHPGESAEWYEFHLRGMDLMIDREPLRESLQKASLVIGPTSTVFLEALIADVQYVVFEPQQNGTDILELPVVPPFDGSDARIPVAKTEEELFRNLQDRRHVDVRCVSEYIAAPFDLSHIRDVVNA